MSLIAKRSFYPLLACTALALAACHKAPAPAPTLRTVLAQQAVPAPNDGGFSLPGDVRSDDDVSLSFRVGGKLAKRLVRVGDVVHRGQVLAELDGADLQSLAQIDQSGLQSAEAHAQWALAQDARTRQQHQQGLSADSETEQSADLAASARATRDSARQRAALSARQQAYGQLLAEDDGVITREEAQPGQVLAAGQAVLGFSRHTHKEIAFDLPEQWLSQLKVGAKLQVQAPAQPARHYEARVTHIGAAADPLSRSFPVRAALGGPAADLALGMSVQVTLSDPTSRTTPRASHDATRQGAVRVPATALFHQGNNPAVWLVDPKAGTLQLQAVQLLRYVGTEVDVTGIAAGEWLVSAGVHALDEHDRVQISTAVRPQDGQP